MAKDRFHDVVRTALEKEGWEITADPYEINVDDVDFEIDLAAEQLLAAELGERKIAVEIKSFISPSNVSEFHTALGQFLNYRDALEKIEPELTSQRKLSPAFSGSTQPHLRKLFSTTVHCFGSRTVSTATGYL
jgi:hypothetical protein